jgi:hypothetical protein
MGHYLAIIVVWNLLFISSYGIDTNVIHVPVLFEHRCCVHHSKTNVICMFVLFRHKRCVSIRIIYTRKLCTRLSCLNNAWHSCVNNCTHEITNFTRILNEPTKPINLWCSMFDLLMSLSIFLSTFVSTVKKLNMFITICSQMFSPYEVGGAMVRTWLFKVKARSSSPQTCNLGHYFS